MALRLHELGEDYELFFTPTGDELPELEEHMRLVSGMVDKPIVTPENKSLDFWIREYKAVPNVFQRWCTRTIKIVPCIAYLRRQPGAELLVGLRADEESRVGLYGDYARYRYPLREWGWGITEVQEYISSRGVRIPERTDCALCPFQRIGEWFALHKRYPDRFQRGVDYETLTGHTFRTPGKERGDGVRLSGRDSWPQRLEELRADFDRGRVPKGYRPDGLRVLQNDGESDACRVCRM